MYIGTSAVTGTGLVTKYNPMTGAVTLNQTIPVTSGTLYADPYVLSVQTIGTQLLFNQLDTCRLGSNFTAQQLGNMSNITWPFASLGTADYESMISCYHI